MNEPAPAWAMQNELGGAWVAETPGNWHQRWDRLPAPPKKNEEGLGGLGDPPKWWVALLAKCAPGGQHLSMLGVGIYCINLNF